MQFSVRTASVSLFPFCSKTNEWTILPNSYVWWHLPQDLDFVHHFDSSDSWNTPRTDHLLRPYWRTFWPQIILPDFDTYNESSAAQTPLILIERDSSKRVVHMSSSNLPVSHISDKGNQRNLLLYSVLLTVCITRQTSACQFLGATHMPWLSHGGSRADCTLALFYSLSHALFSMQRRARQKKAGSSAAPYYIPRHSQQNPWGELPSLREMPLMPSKQQMQFHSASFFSLFCCGIMYFRLQAV